MKSKIDAPKSEGFLNSSRVYQVWSWHLDMSNSLGEIVYFTAALDHIKNGCMRETHLSANMRQTQQLRLQILIDHREIVIISTRYIISVKWPRFRLKCPCWMSMLDVFTKPTPIFYLLSNKQNSDSLASLLLKLFYLATLFILQLTRWEYTPC